MAYIMYFLRLYWYIQASILVFVLLTFYVLIDLPKYHLRRSIIFYCTFTDVWKVLLLMFTFMVHLKQVLLLLTHPLSEDTTGMILQYLFSSGYNKSRCTLPTAIQVFPASVHRRSWMNLSLVKKCKSSILFNSWYLNTSTIEGLKSEDRKKNSDLLENQTHMHCV